MIITCCCSQANLGSFQKLLDEDSFEQIFELVAQVGTLQMFNLIKFFFKLKYHSFTEKKVHFEIPRSDGSTSDRRNFF